MLKYKVLLLTVIVINSCNSSKPDLNKIANDFADIECRAMLLREERFKLANEIRFTQDTLLHRADKTDTTRLNTKLKHLNTQKEAILQTSLNLADSIKHHLDSIMQNHLTNPDDKAKFNEYLHSTLQKKGCIEKPV